MSICADRLSLSTCWCSGRHTDGYAMVDEIARLGFKRIELSHGIRVSLLPGILKAIDEQLIEISSIHNFCPLPVGVNHAAPNLYEPSASDRRERASWVRYTQQTFDFAVKVGAKNVVMHSGSVRFFFRSPVEKLKNWIESEGLNPGHLSENELFVSKRDRTMRLVRKASSKPRKHLVDSYLQVIESVRQHGLRVCIENREGLSEMPFDNELNEFIAMLSAPEQFGYWHDTGHAQIKHNFGLLDHREHLASLKDQLVGFHLHDVNEGGLDHQPVGTGSVDFKMIAEFVRPEHELILELSPKMSYDDVLASRDYICNLLD